MSTPEELYRISIVAADLRFLKEEWDQEVGDDSLRRSSAVLRRLLIENELGRAWRSVGMPGKLQVSAVDLRNVIGDRVLTSIDFAHAGGGSYGGFRIAGLHKTSSPAPETWGSEMHRKPPGFPVRKFALTEFVESPCLIVAGTEITRGELVKYVANKLGGAHTDLRRDESKEFDRKCQLLDTHRITTRIVEKNSVYYELLSIGQALVNSHDVQTFMERCQHAR